jgi:hypothetical protein
MYQRRKCAAQCPPLIRRRRNGEAPGLDDNQVRGSKGRELAGGSPASSPVEPLQIADADADADTDTSWAVV